MSDFHKVLPIDEQSTYNACKGSCSFCVTIHNMLKTFSFSKKVVWTLGILGGLILLAVFLLGRKSSLPTESQANSQNVDATSSVDFVKYYNSTTASGYAQTLFDKLSDGDVTSTQCASLGKSVGDEYMTNFKTVAPVLLLDYTYLYKKHRCVGLTNELLNGDSKNGNIFKIIDIGVIHENLYGSAYIASCQQDLKSNPSIGMITTCDDVFSNSFVTGDANHHSMSPMLYETYQELQKLGSQ